MENGVVITYMKAIEHVMQNGVVITYMKAIEARDAKRSCNNLHESN